MYADRNMHPRGEYPPYGVIGFGNMKNWSHIGEYGAGNRLQIADSSFEPRVDIFVSCCT